MSATFVLLRFSLLCTLCVLGKLHILLTCLCFEYLRQASQSEVGVNTNQTGRDPGLVQATENGSNRVIEYHGPHICLTKYTVRRGGIQLTNA